MKIGPKLKFMLSYVEWMRDWMREKVMRKRVKLKKRVGSLKKKEGILKMRKGSENEDEGSEKEDEGSENETGRSENETGESDSEKKSEENGDETEDELSNYSSDDHCESKNESDSEFYDDPLQVPDPTFWPQELEVEPTNLLPPIIRRMPGRPKKNRRKEPSEAPNAVRRSNMVRCKVCNDHGHNKRTCPVSRHKGKDLELDVPLARLASRKRKAKSSSSQLVAPTRANKKTKSQPVPKPPISSSQLLPNTEHGPSMPVVASSSQPLSNLGASYLPPSFWRGLGVSPQMEIRSKKNQDNKAFNPDVCKQQ
ncbi:hypothetical protein Salat_1465300 [Sesamum alatum]|uniref:Uncharacterized protein n=1 Tax=Sesamum alatum TaxID=300844 RepID=A0AAE2CLV0_9LAMI|nr:hypothetical protein Salat_1465300 [Sesamum alatum]